METQHDGQDPGQIEGASIEAEPMGEGSTPTDADKWKRDLEAKMELMADGVTQLTQTIAQLRQPQAAPVDEFEDLDDDEPITAKRVGKIVSKVVNNAVSTSNVQAQRREWDNKARDQFPISDPTFEAQFNKEWRAFKESGGDVNHPKAVYNVCGVTARLLKTSQTSQRRKVSDEEPTGENPSPSSGVTRSSRSSSSKISDDDNRVRFFRMRNPDPKAVEEFKKKLEAKEQRKRR